MRLLLSALISGVLLASFSRGCTVSTPLTRGAGLPVSVARRPRNTTSHRNSMRGFTVRASPTGAPVIAAALEAALPGSTIRLRKGIYHETITISKPVSLVGEAGAVIDPSEPFRPEWR